MKTMSPKPTTPQFTTPEDAESAFYEAVEQSNLDSLMAVWSDDDEVVCVHPNGQRLTGHPAIRDSWRAILSSGRRLRVDLARSVRWTSMLMSVHSVLEQVTIDGEEGGENGTLTLAATNVFVRGAEGWRLLSHHSSAIADAGDNEPSGPPRVLH
jgi:ketosteroid isomerase-like protein